MSVIWLAAGAAGALIVVFIFVRLFRHLLERRTLAWQNRLLSRNVEEVRSIYTRMRGWRHDYHSHLQTLKAYLAEEKLTEAREYLDRLETDLDEIRPMVESGNVNLDAILNAKLTLAISQEIQVKQQVEVPEKLTVSDIDLCVVIGNLLDNAMEACGKVDNAAERFIRLYIGVLKGQLYISVMNATAETTRKPPEAYVKEGAASEKKGNHGHGLKRIDRVVLKYGGYLNRKNEPGVFATEVLLPL